MPWSQKSHSQLMGWSGPDVHRERLPDTRESAASRGYGRRWARLRMMQLRREPLCRSCAGQGLTVAARQADHIVPKRQGGRDSLDNLQSLCDSCHSVKTNQEKGHAKMV